MGTDRELKKSYKVAAIIGATVIGSLLIYVLMVELIIYPLTPAKRLLPVREVRMLRYILYAFSIINVIILRLIRRAVLKKSSGEKRQELIARLQKSSLISMVLCEGPAIFGLLLYLLTGIKRDFYFLLIVSLLLVFMYFPRLKNWQSWMANLSG